MRQWFWYAIALVGAVLVLWVLFRLVRPRRDIAWPKLAADLPWGTPDDALSKVYAYVVAFADGTIAWYYSRRQPKRHWGVCLRFGALLATAAAGFIPLAEPLHLTATAIPAAWSTVLLAAAGVLVSIDSLGGFTSGWVRYMFAQQKVERARDAFQMEWNTLKLGKAAPTNMLERATAFLLAVGKIVDDETQSWATDFQNALKELEKARVTAEATERTGGLEVVVKNHAAVTSWTLEIDGTQRGQTSGKNLAVTDVAIGMRKLKASGKDQSGKTLADEKVVKIEGGATLTKELELT